MSTKYDGRIWGGGQMFEQLHFTNHGRGLRLKDEEPMAMDVKLIPRRWWSLKAWRFAREANKTLVITAMAKVKQKGGE